LALTAAASVLGIILFAGAGVFRPIFNTRYLGPFVPGVMLGLLLALRWVARGERRVAYGALTLLASVVCLFWLVAGAPHPDSNFDSLNFEVASQRLMRAGVSRVVFVWDNPTTRSMRPQEVEAMSGFFFRRAGLPIVTTPVNLSPGQDPNAALLAKAAPQGAAILWLFDRHIPGTAAAAYPPRLAALDPRYLCRDYSEDGVGTVVCFEPQSKPNP
jgi:hypothetical protein